MIKDSQLLLHCDNAVYAEEIKMLLQTKGIECFINDEAKTEVIGSTGGNRAEIAIYVDQKDYDAAHAVVDEINKKREEQMPWCPKCGAEDISKTVVPHQHGPLWLLIVCVVCIVSMLILLIIPRTVHISFLLWSFLFALWIFLLVFWFKSYKVERFTCKKCSHTFKRIKYTKEDKQ